MLCPKCNPMYWLHPLSCSWVWRTTTSLTVYNSRYDWLWRPRWCTASVVAGWVRCGWEGVWGLPWSGAPNLLSVQLTALHPALCWLLSCSCPPLTRLAAAHSTRCPCLACMCARSVSARVIYAIFFFPFQMNLLFPQKSVSVSLMHTIHRQFILWWQHRKGGWAAIESVERTQYLALFEVPKRLRQTQEPSPVGRHHGGPSRAHALSAG